MALLAGVDGCPGGWLCVTLDTDTGLRSAIIYSSADELLAAKPKPSVLAADMPIGLPDSGIRVCDSQAKEKLGSRQMCVFFAPTRRALLAPSRIAAGRILNRGVTCFEWELYSKIKNLDHYLTVDDQSHVFEVHPEVCFYAMNSDIALSKGKKTPEGMRAREDLLDSYFPGLRSLVLDALADTGYGRKLLGLDDVHDAIAALWSARRSAENKANVLPETLEKDARGLRMAIWV
jgi:predicted RNase H-like nuclease